MLDVKTIQQHQLENEELQDLIQNSSSLQLQQLSINTDKIYRDILSGIVRPYIPRTLRKTTFNIIHGLSHPSGRETSQLLREKYIWPGIKKNVIKWSRKCIPCQKAKIHRHTKTKPEHINVPNNRLNRVDIHVDIHVDIIILSEVRGCKYCLTIIDRFSRWPTAVPLQDITADTIITALFDNWIAHYGTLLTITSGQGSQFESTLFHSLTKFIGAKK